MKKNEKKELADGLMHLCNSLMYTEMALTFSAVGDSNKVLEGERLRKEEYEKAADCFKKFIG